MILEQVAEALFGKKCNHEHMSLDKDFGYCPDCGALIENQWFIVKCSCCGIKQKATIRNGKVVPIGNFCHNCGSEKFKVEKLDTIDFININYAVLQRKEVKHENKNDFVQCWVDSTGKHDEQPKLLPIFQ